MVTNPGKGVGGLPKRRIDQQPVPPPTAVSPGSSNIIRASVVIITGGAGSGLFVYSPSPGVGNLVASITGASGTDQYGNAYGSGLNIGNQAAAHFGVSNAGDVFIANASDQNVIEIRPELSAILIYNGAPSLGGLVATIAGAAGTDPQGNTFPAGVASYNSGNTSYVLLGNTGISGTTMQLIFQNLANAFLSPPFVEALGSGTAGATLELNSGESGGSSGAAAIILQDSTAAPTTNSLVTIASGGLSGPALLSSTNSFQGPLTLPLPHQTTSNNTISTTAGSLSTADRNSINGLVNAVNTLQANLQAANMEL
jgi:hypothetical protein